MSSRSFDSATPDWLRKINMPIGANSLAVWAKATTLSTVQNLMVAEHWRIFNPIQLAQFRLFVGATNLISGEINDSGGASGADTTASISTGVWFQAVVTADADTINAYLNGANKGSSANNNALRNWPRHSVAADWDGSLPFDGQIAHIAAWNVMLTDAEVRALYEGQCSPMDIGVQTDALVYYAELDNNDLCLFGEGAAGSQLEFGTQGAPTFADDDPGVYPMIGGIVAA